MFLKLSFWYEVKTLTHFLVCFQLLDLLSNNTKLTRDRQLLAREVEFLRKEITKSQEDDLQKYFSSNKALVDEILTNVTADERGKKVNFLLTDPEEDIIISESKEPS